MIAFASNLVACVRDVLLVFECHSYSNGTIHAWLTVASCALVFQEQYRYLVCIATLEKHSMASIHTQHDYDKIADLAQHYTQPLMIGLRSDHAGNWAWEDGSRVDTAFLVAHSFDGLNGGADFSASGGASGTDESVGVFYPPVCQTGWDNGVHQDNTGDGDTCDGDSQDPEHFKHQLHDWGNGDTPMAFVCSASGEQRRMHLGSETVPGYGPPPPPVIEVPGCMDPSAKNYDPAANVDDGSCRGGGH